jgi:hypothetical protein
MMVTVAAGLSSGTDMLSSLTRLGAVMSEFINMQLTLAASDRVLVPHERQQLPSSLTSRLRELSSLGPDWIDGALPVSDTSVTTARILLERTGLPPPRIFPTPEGGVSLEWLDDTQDLSAEIDSEGRVYIHCYYLSTRESSEAHENSVSRAGTRLWQLLGGGPADRD